MTVQIPLILGPSGRIAQLPTGDTIAGGGAGTSIGLPAFATIADAQVAAIPSTVNNIQLFGHNRVGDGGGGIYNNVANLITRYVGDGNPANSPPIPPGFTSSAPYLVCASTSYDATFAIIGPSSQSITAHCLTVLVAFSWSATIPPSFSDSAGNTYVQAVFDGVSSGWPCAMYYCANPVPAAPGTTFKASDGEGATSLGVYVFCVPGFFGATLDKTASQLNSSFVTGMSLATTGSTHAVPSIAIGAIYASAIPSTRSTSFFPYTPPVGWIDLMPPLLGGQAPISATVASSGNATYNPTWASSNLPVVALLATFYATPTYYQTSFAATNWQLVPTFPVHTAQYGIDPASPDNAGPFQSFGKWLASIAPPSGTSLSANQGQAGFSGVCTISGATITLFLPHSIGINPSSFANYHGISNGMMVSLSTTGVLPSPLVPGKRYFAQYGTITQNSAIAPPSIQLSETSIFGGEQTVLKGTAITTSGPQSGGVFVDTALTIGYSSLSGGSGYVSSGIPYHRVPLTGGSGTGATADITVTGGVVVGVRAVDVGSNYVTGDVLSASNANLGGSGIGFSVTLSSVTHYFTTYGESWTDFVLDTGIYRSTNNQAPGPGTGIKKWRMFAYGARFQTNVYFDSVAWNDVNAATTGSTVYSAKFQSTNWNNGTAQNYVDLITPAQASNFYPNSWVVLMCQELLASAAGNWTQPTFEYKKVRSINASTGRIMFFDALQYNYRSTFPVFGPAAGFWSGSSTGPATIVQLSDVFDQEAEIHGLNIYAWTEQQASGIKSLRFVDCEILDGDSTPGHFLA